MLLASCRHVLHISLDDTLLRYDAAITLLTPPLILLIRFRRCFIIFAADTTIEFRRHAAADCHFFTPLAIRYYAFAAMLSVAAITPFADTPAACCLMPMPPPPCRLQASFSCCHMITVYDI